MNPSSHIATLALVIVALAGCLGTTQARSPASPPTEGLEVVPMINHIQLGVFEMDVFIERPTDVGKVFRPSPAEATDPTTAAAPLFATGVVTPHDPSFSNPGPFERGAALGFGLDDWLAGSGSAAYLCTGGTQARVDAAFSRLVPNGLYTFWNARLVFQGGAITGGTDIPLGASDGSQTVFRADEKGSARFSAAWTGCNEPSTAGPGIGPDGSARVFAIAYHSDGQTFGSSPGSFGQATHVQLFGIVKGAPAA